MSRPAIPQALVVMTLLLIAIVMYPELRGAIRAFPLVVVALLGALAMHAYARGRVGP